MIGRQGLHVDKTTLATNFCDFGMNAVDSGAMLKQADGYAEPFLKSLGAREVDSIDASDYESATIIHDMNLPVADQHKTAFDVVLDGGSLEHIFNFPIARPEERKVPGNTRRAASWASPARARSFGR